MWQITCTQLFCHSVHQNSGTFGLSKSTPMPLGGTHTVLML